MRIKYNVNENLVKKIILTKEIEKLFFFMSHNNVTQ